MYLPEENSARPLPDGSASASGSSASLTYEPFYGLREKPFSLSADPRFLYKSPAHASAFDAILAGIRRREGLIVVTGEIGTGKTTLCRSVVQHLDRRTFAAFVADPFVSREDLLKTLLVDFGVIAISDLTRGRFNNASRSELSYLLYEFLDSLVPLQAFAVLVIDETQNLSLPLLEEIRILSELERREKLLQVVLVGQPELRANLRLPQMRQVDQRVSVRCELKALDAEGVVRYVHHRLIVAGLGGSTIEFTDAALDALYQGSNGVPRVINRLCDRALARAYAARTKHIDPQLVWDAIDDLGYAHDDHDRSTTEKPAAQDVSVTVSIAEPVQLTAFEPVAIPAAQTDTRSLLFEEFESEADLPPSPPVAPAPPVTRQQWTAVAVASMLIVAASVGIPAWYVRAHVAEDSTVASPQPPLPPHTFSAPGIVAPAVEVTEQASSAEHPTVASPVAAAAQESNYTIVVASFTNPERAQLLVDELTSAGFQARAVDHDWGPPRGRILQVNVGNYASAIDAQRDLQQIRELPGNYQDARVVERQ